MRANLYWATLVVFAVSSCSPRAGPVSPHSHQDKAPPAGNGRAASGPTQAEVYQRLRKIVAQHLGVDPKEVTENATFTGNLRADSLDTVELVMAMEEEFDIEIPDEAAERMHTVGDAVTIVGELLRAKARSPQAEAPKV